MFWQQHFGKHLLRVTNIQQLFKILFVVGNPGNIFLEKKPLQGEI